MHSYLNQLRNDERTPTGVASIITAGLVALSLSGCFSSEAEKSQDKKDRPFLKTENLAFINDPKACKPFFAKVADDIKNDNISLLQEDLIFKVALCAELGTDSSSIMEELSKARERAEKHEKLEKPTHSHDKPDFMPK